MKLCVVAGEASGDLHAAELVHALRRYDPQLELFGIGGDLLAAEGMRIDRHAREMAIVGLFNVLRQLPLFLRVFRETIRSIVSERPDAVLLVDYPGFNLRIARRCRALGIRVIYYISPQLWAWRQGRVKDIARDVDEMIVVFPFEETFYRSHAVPVTYVGHPLIGQLADVERASHDLPSKEGGPLRIALMPGSRKMEVESLLVPMLDAVEVLRATREVDAFVIQAPTIDDAPIKELLESRNGISVVRENRSEALASAHLSISSSGTATLESAILGVPVIVVYKLSAATWFLATRLVKIPHVSLVNIVAGKKIVPELLQGEVTGQKIAAAAGEMLKPDAYAELLRELDRVRILLGEPGAGERAAARVYRLVTRT